MREGVYLRIVNVMSYVAVTGHGPYGTASMSGLGSGMILAIGGNPARGLVLAGTLQASTIESTLTGGPFEDATLTLDDESIDASTRATAAFSQLGALVDWYPDPAAGWHAGLSAGLGLTSLVIHADASQMFGTGAAGTLFGGYDWAIGPQWSLGIGLVASGNTSAKLMDTDGADTEYRLRAFSVGLAGSLLNF